MLVIGQFNTIELPNSAFDDSLSPLLRSNTKFKPKWIMLETSLFRQPPLKDDTYPLI